MCTDEEYMAKRRYVAYEEACRAHAVLQLGRAGFIGVLLCVRDRGCVFSVTRQIAGRDPGRPEQVRLRRLEGRRLCPGQESVPVGLRG
jgi:hypothetical protein